MKRTKIALTALTFSAFIFMAIASSSDEKGGDGNGAASSSTESSSKVVELGQPLQTDYFSVKVNKFDLKDKVSTGNEFADLKKEEGNKYVIINVTLKNTDSESRMMFDGELLVKSGGKDYKYENAETVMAEGWGILMENINPGVTKTTNIVYKVPSDLKGDVYYVPARSSEMIKIGTL